MVAVSEMPADTPSGRPPVSQWLFAASERMETATFFPPEACALPFRSTTASGSTVRRVERKLALVDPIECN